MLRVNLFQFMGDTATLSIEELKEKVERLIAAYERKSSENTQLIKENKSLKEQLAEQTQVALNGVASENGDLKHRIDGLISEVDKCLDLLKN
jgi:cell shape-determining protein MreC